MASLVQYDVKMSTSMWPCKFYGQIYEDKSAPLIPGLLAKTASKFIQMDTFNWYIYKMFIH